MHIGIDIRPLLSPERTGIGEYTFEFLNALFSKSTPHEYTLLYNIFNKKNTLSNIQWQSPQVQYQATHWPNKLFNASLSILKRPYLDRVIGKKPLDIFFSPHLNFTSLSPSIPSLLTVHDISFTIAPNFFTLKQNLWHKAIHPEEQCRKARMIITPSENTKRDLAQLYRIDPEKIQVLYPGLSSLFSPAAKVSTRDHIKQKYQLPTSFILFLGTIEPRKNILGLIEAFEQNNSKLPKPYTLVIAGSMGWKNTAVYRRAQSSLLKERIKFIGYIAPEDKPALLEAADLFVYPSFYEGFGFPVLEAMAMGTPVITSARSSLPEITGRTAYLINPHKPHEIAQGINRILNNEDLKNTLRVQGKNQAQKFNWHTTIDQWLRLIEQMYENRH
jgi:glycosyltransferase involved in cell wall biosynthesis